MPLGKHLGQLIAHPFSRNDVNLGGQLLDRCPCRWLDRISETCRKTQRTQHAQFIFGGAPLWIADRTDDLALQIPSSAHEIKHFVGQRIEQHPVDREVAPGDVLARIPAETHLIRVSSVRITNIAAESGDLYNTCFRRGASSYVSTIRIFRS